MTDQRPLLQYVLTTGQRTWGTRLFADGRVEEYSNVGVVVRDDGNFAAHGQPLKWRRRAQLTPAEVQQLTQVIAGSDFFDLPAQLGAPGQVRDGSTIVWTLSAGGKQHEVTAYGPDQQSQPTLEKLRTTFEAMVTEALNR